MSSSRREFLEAAAAAAGAALATSCASGGSSAPPYQVQVRRPDGAGRTITAAAVSPAGPVAIPAAMPMGSGAPLGGIGTGFLEIRPDGCFHEWQIFNSGQWAQGSRSTTAAPPAGPQYLRFLVRTKKPSDTAPQLRRLYLRSDENDLYSLPFVQDIESISYDAWYPMTGLRYNDSSLPVRISAVSFSPFVPGNTRLSSTPGFHMVFTLENTSNQPVEASLVSFLDDPIASALPDRKLTHTLRKDNNASSLLYQSDAQAEVPTGIGSMCLSVTGGEHSWITGTFRQYAVPGPASWSTRRVSAMLLGVLDEVFASGRLPNTEAATDPSREFTLTAAQIDALSVDELQTWQRKLSADALFNRVFADARAADVTGFGADTVRALLKEISNNISNARGGLAGADRSRSTWGTGALASSVRLAPGQKIDIRFTLSWFFPHHITPQGREAGHMYANWFEGAADVGKFLLTNYDSHRAQTEAFARAMIETSLGDALAFSWSSQLGCAVTNTWWTKDGNYGIWEGIGCCGMSTTDVEYQGSWLVTALFPELKLNQMKRIATFQDNQGRIPHNFTTAWYAVDRGFARVDMNPQFVMMACRDYLWTGDKDYLQTLWPTIVKCMDFTASLDTDGDGLPDRDTSLQTYDQWGMRGAPSYVASLWIGGLRAAIRLAKDAGKTADAARWTALLEKASASFDKLLFNGQFYSLWVDGQTRDEVCMSDQISGEWFSHLIGLPTTISQKNLDAAVDAILKHNFNPEFGLHNATAPKGGRALLAVTNHQAGGVWSGIEFAFASFLMDHGRFEQGAQVVAAVHRRHFRAGRPWNHNECGDHYSRAMSSWATLLAATGFKPDVPAQTLAILPSVPSDFHAPWATASGFGTLRRQNRTLTIECANGSLAFKTLRVNLANRNPAARLAGRALAARASAQPEAVALEFAAPVSIAAGQALVIE